MADLQRVNLRAAAPHAFDALLVLTARVTEQAAEAGLDPRLVELVKIRASQLNGCAFCLRLHTEDALEAGESVDRLAVLSAWRETGYFTEAERAALTLCEAVTVLGDGHVSDDAYAAAAEKLSAEQIAGVAWMTIVMNAFNRLAITSRYRVQPASAETVGPREDAAGHDVVE